MRLCEASQNEAQLKVGEYRTGLLGKRCDGKAVAVSLSPSWAFLKGCYTLDNSAIILCHLQEGRWKSLLRLPGPDTWHFSALSTWGWGMTVRWKEFDTIFRGNEIWSLRLGPLFYFFLFLRNTYTYFYVCIHVRRRERRWRGDREDYPIYWFISHFQEQKLLFPSFLCGHCNICSTNGIVLLTNVKLNCSE